MHVCASKAPLMVLATVTSEPSSTIKSSLMVLATVTSQPSTTIKSLTNTESSHYNMRCNLHHLCSTSDTLLTN